jgi:hypothetical protein
MASLKTYPLTATKRFPTGDTSLPSSYGSDQRLSRAPEAAVAPPSVAPRMYTPLHEGLVSSKPCGTSGDGKTPIVTQGHDGTSTLPVSRAVIGTPSCNVARISNPSTSEMELRMCVCVCVCVCMCVCARAGVRVRVHVHVRVRVRARVCVCVCVCVNVISTCSHEHT